MSADALERELREDPARPVVAVGLSEELAGKVAALRPAYRRMVELHYVEGHSIEQTAALMGCSVASVKGIIPRALKELRPAGVKAKTKSDLGVVTRARLLEAARQVVAERGVNGAKGCLIAQRAGVAPSRINHHFGSYAGLVAQATATAPGAIAA